MWRPLRTASAFASFIEFDFLNDFISFSCLTNYYFPLHAIIESVNGRVVVALSCQGCVSLTVVACGSDQVDSDNLAPEKA